MKKTGCTRWGLWGGLLGVALLCIVGISIYYFQARARAFNSRPLVLIHSPVHHDVVRNGDGILVHASARENNGLKRIELWVDDQLLAARDAPHSVTSLTLTGTWVSSQAGSHAIVARAISWDGVEGQATVVVQTDVSGAAQPTHVVQEGETAESIAADYGVSPEDLAASNPDLGSAAPGDELLIPEGEASPLPPVDPPPPGGGDPPADVGVAPGSADLLVGWVHSVFQNLPEEGEGLPAMLRLEVVRLQTSQGFDSLHCYVGLADGSPQWFPDTDGDQTTDESFAPLGGGLWEVEPYPAGEAAPTVTWPNNQPLPVNISCVGMAGGGTDAVELGRMELSIPRENWDGVRRTEGADGEGGHIELEYVVTRDDSPHGIPIILDPTMNVPTNVRLDEANDLLLWDYVPQVGENAINGFHIYLNGSLQWSVPPEARETSLPEEWFQIPCGMTYTYEVEAYRLVAEEPYSYESARGEVELHQETEDCTRTVQVIFTTLETFYLGTDGDHEQRTGDVGPPYGDFSANEGAVTFDGGLLPEPFRYGVLGTASGFEYYQTYDLDSSSFVYNFNISGSYVDVDIPYGGSLQVSFSIMNRNSGTCGRVLTRGCDRLICEATSDLYYDSPDMLNFYTWQEGTLMSSDGRCRLSYRFGPRYDSTAFSPHNPGGVGLPQMDAGRITILGETGGLQVGVHNTGTADWTAHDLVMDLQTRDGTHITRFTVEDFALETGVWRSIDFPPGTLSPPFDACVVIDPDNLVREEIDSAGGRQPVCAELPDLVITYMEYPEWQTRLRVLVENVGEGDLIDRTLVLRLFTPHGDPLNTEGTWNDISLESGEAEYFEMDIAVVDRDELSDGYEIVVDPDTLIPESDEGNNRYFVPYLGDTDD